MLHQICVTQFSKVLGNLSNFLTQANEFASAKKIDVTVLLNSRLAPDQFNLIKQVQVATDTAKLCAARLTGNLDSAPKHEDTETTLEELQARIQGVVDYLASFNEADFVNAESVEVTHARWGDKHMTGRDFAIEYAMPNFYFHVTTAYEILRHNGVELGKLNYLGALTLR